MATVYRFPKTPGGRRALRLALEDGSFAAGRNHGCPPETTDWDAIEETANGMYEHCAGLTHNQGRGND